jgi:hypothetical protein
MWEVRAAPGQIDELVAHLARTADPAAAIYRSADGEERVVVIDPSDSGIAHVPPHLVAREPHIWRFLPVDRASLGCNNL